MTAKARIYIGFVIAAGALALIAGLLDWKSANPPLFTVFVVLASASAVLKVRLPGITGTMSVSVLFVLVSISEFSLPETLVVSACSALVQTFWGWKEALPIQVAFNISLLSVATLFAHDSFHWMIAQPYPGFALSLLLTSGVYFLANTLPVAIVIGITERKRAVFLWKECYLWSFPYYLLGAAVAGFAHVFVKSFGWQPLLLSLPVLYLLYRSYRLYLERLESEQDHASELAREVEAQTAELRKTNKSLAEARDRAEEAARIKSEFLANMSHELRTPLNAVIGYSEMLEEDAEADGLDHYATDLQKIQTAGRNLLALINDVLDISKIEAGRMELHAEPIVIRDLINEAVITTEPLVKKNGNQLVVRCLDDRGTMFGDLLRLRQSVINLLSNACKFTENGTITLEVEREVIEGREWVNWHVRDTGIGIAPEQQKKLFQSFSQVDASATRKYGGTGLGLAISQQLCQMMGGRITLESEAGQGATFTIRLPADCRKDAEPAPPPARDLSTERGPVLVIDDGHPKFRILAVAVLHKARFQVLVSPGGEDGLQRARDLEPVTILLKTPRVADWSMLKDLKADAATAHVPVIVLTAAPNHSAAREMGAEICLDQHFSPQDLVAAVDSCVNRTTDGPGENGSTHPAAAESAYV